LRASSVERSLYRYQAKAEEDTSEMTVWKIIIEGIEAHLRVKSTGRAPQRTAQSDDHLFSWRAKNKRRPLSGSHHHARILDVT